MMKNKLKEKLHSEESVYGLFVAELYTPNMSMLLEAAGADFVIFDQEHGIYDLSHQHGVLPGFRNSTVTPIVRVPAIRREFFQPPLDLGVGGLIVPSVESAEQVETCVNLMKFAPQGTRGLSLSRPHTGFRSVRRDDFVKEANQENLLIIQIETKEGMNRLDEILSVPGIDLVFVGCADLSLSLGVAPDPSQGPLHEALDTVLRAARNHGLPTGANISKPEIIPELTEKGLRLISCTTDIRAFLGGVKSSITSLLQTQR